MKYFVNAPARRSKRASARGKRRSPAQKAATRKMLAANKRARRAVRKSTRRASTKRSPTVAKRRRKRGGARRTARRSSSRRRKSTAVKRRSPITRLRRRSVYVTNPRRKRRRGYYGSNPSYLKQAIQISKDTAAVLVGGAAGRTIGGMLPSFGNPVAEAAKGVLIAIGIRIAAARFLGADVARFAAAGAMQVPLKNLVVGFVPQAAPFLGDYDLASLSSYAGALPGGVGNYEDATLGSYTDVFTQ